MASEATSEMPNPAPGTAGKFDRLKSLLREMFQLDRGDLDFGLYRIMNMKAKEVSGFLDEALLPQVRTALSGFSDEARAEIEKELREETAVAERLAELKERLADARADAEAEADVYGHLANFFGRYYSEGDFMSQRRYSGGGGPAYLVPWDGEEVKLHWANADQYYVKTTENYASYAFSAGDRRARFEIAAAAGGGDGAKDSGGGRRRFLLAATDPVGIDGGRLVVRFEHRPLTEGEKQIWGAGAGQQARLNAAAAERVLNMLDPEWRAALSRPAPTDSNPERTLLAMHVERYAAKNSFDYFIHKDLGGFLLRELDFYIKNEVLDLKDLEIGDPGQLRRALGRTRAIRLVGEKIVAFLAQLEEFQKRLWLKKKFVLETNWCVTLDRVPESLYPEIAGNAAQREEWESLFAIDGIEGAAGRGGPLEVGFLEENPYLVLDTKHFDRDFTDRLLAALSDAGPLDDQVDGLLVHGENFQALNLLEKRYRGQVGCVYIDPPYNTGDSEILYKNGYLRSSWLTLMSNRLKKVSDFLDPDGVLFIAIDDFEMPNLCKLIDTQHASMRREMIIVNHHPQGGKAKTLAHTHEYMLACLPASSDKTLVGRNQSDEAERRPFKRSGTAISNFRQGRPNSFYAILVDSTTQEIVGLDPPPDGQQLSDIKNERWHDQDLSNWIERRRKSLEKVV